MGEQLARFNPGDNVPVFAQAQVFAGRFLKILAGKSAQGDYRVEHADPGEAHPFGVAEADSGPATQDQYSIERRINTVRRPSVGARVRVGAEVKAGDLAAVGAAGKGVPALAASLVTGVVGNNNAITWTARDVGVAGNGASVTIVDPPGNNVALSVDTDGDEITVTLATDGASAPTSTAAQVMAAIAEHDTASRLVSVKSTGASSGAGVVAAVAKTNLAGGTGPVVGRFLTDADNDEIAECELF